MVAEEPEVAGLGDGRLGHFRDVVGVGERAVFADVIEELLELAFTEAEEVEVGAVLAECVEELREVVLLPLAPLLAAAERAVPCELVGHVLDDGRDLRHAEVLYVPSA